MKWPQFNILGRTIYTRTIGITAAFTIGLSLIAGLLLFILVYLLAYFLFPGTTYSVMLGTVFWLNFPTSILIGFFIGHYIKIHTPTHKLENTVVLILILLVASQLMPSQPQIPLSLNLLDTVVSYGSIIIALYYDISDLVLLKLARKYFRS